MKKELKEFIYIWYLRIRKVWRTKNIRHLSRKYNLSNYGDTKEVEIYEPKSKIKR